MIFRSFKCLTLLVCFVLLQAFFHKEVFGQNLYKAVITDLNTKTETLLEAGKIYYFEVKNNPVLQSGKLIEVKSDSLNFEGKNYAIQQITAIGYTKFKRLNGWHKTAKIAAYAGAISLLTGILMSSSAEDWQPIEKSFFGAATMISMPLIIPSVLFLKFHKGPEFDLIHQHLLEIKKAE